MPRSSCKQHRAEYFVVDKSPAIICHHHHHLLRRGYVTSTTNNPFDLNELCNQFCQRPARKILKMRLSTEIWPALKDQSTQFPAIPRWFWSLQANTCQANVLWTWRYSHWLQEDTYCNWSRPKNVPLTAIVQCFVSPSNWAIPTWPHKPLPSQPVLNAHAAQRSNKS